VPAYFVCLERIASPNIAARVRLPQGIVEVEPNWICPVVSRGVSGECKCAPKRDKSSSQDVVGTTFTLASGCAECVKTNGRVCNVTQRCECGRSVAGDILFEK
jgi:hypothetical protein